MRTLVCAVDDCALVARIARIMRSDSRVEVVPLESDSQAMVSFVSSRHVDGCIYMPMSPDRFVELRRSLAQGRCDAHHIRSGVLVDFVDAACVYHKLAYGVDDVIDISRSDDDLRRDLIKFACGTELACSSYLVPTVDVPFPIVHGEIKCADDVDEKIVRLLSVGFTDREVGEILHFSHQVIRNRVSHLLLRSGLRNRTQLAARYTIESIERGRKSQP